MISEWWLLLAFILGITYERGHCSKIKEDSSKGEEDAGC